jgi:hypothetical protein
MSMLSVLCVMLSFILFLLGASSRWWSYATPNPRPYYPAFISAGLAFLVLGVWLLPLIIPK